VSDGPPKTLSSRFQTLSQARSRWNRPERRPRRQRDRCRRPRPPRRQKTGFSGGWRPNKQSRIVLLAPLPKERKPTIRQPTCNALNPSRPLFYAYIPETRPGWNWLYSSPTFPRTRAPYSGLARRRCVTIPARRRTARRQEICNANAPYGIVSAMTKDQVKQVLDRVLSWPQERQEDAAQMLLALEARQGELYHPDDDEWAAIEEGFAQAKRGEAISADEIAALLKPRGS
jgi:hypothetical protein